MKTNIYDIIKEEKFEKDSVKIAKMLGKHFTTKTIDENGFLFRSQVTDIDNIIYAGYYNDLFFISVDSLKTMNLTISHEGTFNPNHFLELEIRDGIIVDFDRDSIFEIDGKIIDLSKIIYEKEKLKKGRFFWQKSYFEKELVINIDMCIFKNIIDNKLDEDLVD